MKSSKSKKMYRNNNMPNTTNNSALFDEIAGWVVICVDTCSYGRVGLRSALNHSSFMSVKQQVISISTPDEILPLIRPRALKSLTPLCLVVRLPPLPREALIALLQLSEMMQHVSMHHHRLVVLSPFDFTAVYNLMNTLGMATACILDARLPLSILCREVLLAPEQWRPKGSFLRQVLTAHERSALRQTLQFRSASQQARVRQVTQKTIHSHRLKALMKLGVKNIRCLFSLLMPV